MGNSELKTAAIRKLLDKADCPSANCSAVLSFEYNGDYPGCPCVRLGMPEQEDWRWLTANEQSALCSIFGVRTLGQLYDLAGAVRTEGEHAPFTARISLQNS
jgi:hypothetical protein